MEIIFKVIICEKIKPCQFGTLSIIYIAYSVFRYGDFIPAGLEYLTTLSDNFHYKPTINVLNCIVHMFFENPHILTDNEK